jgi:plastocyanin
LCLALILAVALGTTAAAAQTAKGGVIKGHIRFEGKHPGNAIIRMGLDPLCNRMNAGKRVVQETVLASVDGSLANVFIRLQGSFPATPVPSEPVTIDQRGCVYEPRVVGVRVGQVLQVRNSDNLLHNVHSLSARGNTFNVSEPKAGMVQQFRMKDEEVMFRIKCDIHSWMTAFVGVVSNPYFARSDIAGVFQIANIPPGTYTLQAWHERFGSLTQTVRVRGGATTDVQLSYTAKEKPPTAELRELRLQGTAFTAN